MRRAICFLSNCLRTIYISQAVCGRPSWTLVWIITNQTQKNKWLNGYTLWPDYSGSSTAQLSRLIYQTWDTKAAHASVLAGTCWSSSLSPEGLLAVMLAVKTRQFLMPHTTWREVGEKIALKTSDTIFSRAYSEATYNLRKLLLKILGLLCLQRKKKCFEVGILLNSTLPVLPDQE